MAHALRDATRAWAEAEGKVIDLLVWAGPIVKYQAPDAAIVGAKELWLGCRGDVTVKYPHCPKIGEALMGSPSLLLAKAGIPSSKLRDLYLSAFSAGGSVQKRLLQNSDYRKIITSVTLFDASYTAQWRNKAQRIPPPITGYVDYAVDVIEGPGDKLFVATASPSPNGQWATGVENLQAVRREVESRTGLKFQEIDFFGVEPGPEHAYRLGNVIFAEYPMKPLGHNHPKISGQVYAKIVQPWLDKGKGPIDKPGGISPVPVPVPTIPSPEPTVADWMIVGAAAALTFWGVLKFSRKGAR